MPLGREKSHIRVLTKLETSALVVRAPMPGVIPPLYVLSWLVNKAFFTGVAAETIEQWGNGAARGYRLEFDPSTGQFTFTTYGGGGASVTTGNGIDVTAAGQGLFAVVQVSQATATISIKLNNGTAVSAAGTTAAVLTTDDRILTAQSAGGVNGLLSLAVAQCAQGVGASLANSGYYAACQQAQRLLEPPSCFSYINFGRYGARTASGAQGHFGDDVTGARIECPSPSVSAHEVDWRQSNAFLNWSTA